MGPGKDDAHPDAIPRDAEELPQCIALAGAKPAEEARAESRAEQRVFDRVASYYGGVHAAHREPR